MKAILNRDIEKKDFYQYNKGEKFKILDNNQNLLIHVEDWLGFKYWLKKEYFDYETI
jgi:hypothetical protein